MTSDDRPHEVSDDDVDDWLEVCLSELAESGPVDAPDDLAAMIDRLAPKIGDDTRHFLFREVIKLDMAMVADFNVSIHDANTGDSTESLGGSIGYMSPEHLDAIGNRTAGGSPGASYEVGIPADLYSLGVLLWELWQGKRPFESPAVPESPSKSCLSWDEAVQQQRGIRDKPMLAPCPDDSPSARVLERALRQAMQPDPGDRFASGAEMAGRLRLALHPDAATLFDPDERTLRSRLFRISPWLLACAVLLIPHMIAGAINFQYNYWEVMPDDKMRTALNRVSWGINSTFFPVALGFAIWYARRIVRAVATAKDNEMVDREDISGMLALGRRGAVVGGILWILSGIMFPVIFWAMGLPLDTNRSIHFFASAVVCGGIAIIYPYFGMGLLASLVFYPRCLSRSIRDPDFQSRRTEIICRGERYLMLAAILPLLGAALMIVSQQVSPSFQLLSIAAGILGLFAAALAQRRIVRTWNQLAEILSSRRNVL